MKLRITGAIVLLALGCLLTFNSLSINKGADTKKWEGFKRSDILLQRTNEYKEFKCRETEIVNTEPSIVGGEFSGGISEVAGTVAYEYGEYVEPVVQIEQVEQVEQEPVEQVETTEPLDNNARGKVKNIPDVEYGFKAFMDYRKITSRTSPQYILQQSKFMRTDENGFRRYKDDYVVALGSYYATKIGTRVRIELETGKVIYAVLGDQKSDRHTDPLHQHRNGNVVEFIVDNELISNECRQSGNMSFSAGLQGKVVSIEVIDYIEENEARVDMETENLENTDNSEIENTDNIEIDNIAIVSVEPIDMKVDSLVETGDIEIENIGDECIGIEENNVAENSLTDSNTSNKSTNEIIGSAEINSSDTDLDIEENGIEENIDLEVEGSNDMYTEENIDSNDSLSDIESVESEVIE